MATHVLADQIASVDQKEEESLCIQPLEMESGNTPPTSQKPCALLFRSGVAQAVVAVTLWVLLGTIFYRAVDEFTWGQSFYYAVQAGLSVGFGALTETSDESKLFTVFFVLMGSSAIGGVLSLFAQSALERHENLLKSMKRPSMARERHKARRAARLRTGCAAFFSDHRNVLQALAGFSFWILVGIIFGMAAMDLSFISGLYFAVTACSTGGLLAPTTGFAFVGFYCLLGIPLFGHVLGQFADVFISKYSENQQDKVLDRGITETEFNYVKNMGSQDNALDFGEFCIISLLRLEHLDVETLDEIREKFNVIDADHNGEVTFEELLQLFDKDHDGRLDGDEDDTSSNNAGAGQLLRQANDEESPEGVDQTDVLIQVAPHANAASDETTCLSTGIIQALAAVAVWVLIGTIFYRQVDQFTWGQSFYYAVQAGLSVGFGALTEVNDGSKLFTVFFVLLGSSGIGGVLSLFTQNALERHQNLLKSMRRPSAARERHKARRAEKMRVGCAKFLKKHRNMLRAMAAFCFWILVGIIFGMAAMDLSFVNGLYFAVTACSTGGLLAPTTGFAFVGFYCLVGIPLFGHALGQFANVFINQYTENQQDKVLDRSITQTEFDYVKSLSGNDNNLDLGEYVILCSLRRGDLDIETLGEIRERFGEIDLNHDGEVTYAELLELFDLDHDGVLDGE